MINGFPFEVKRQEETSLYAPMTEKEMLAKLKRSRERECIRDAEQVISDIKGKYRIKCEKW